MGAWRHPLPRWWAQPTDRPSPPCSAPPRLSAKRGMFAEPAWSFVHPRSETAGTLGILAGVLVGASGQLRALDATSFRAHKITRFSSRPRWGDSVRSSQQCLPILRDLSDVCAAPGGDTSFGGPP